MNTLNNIQSSYIFKTLMIARNFIWLTALYFWMNFQILCGVVKESELLARWSFDEGNGTKSIEKSGSGVNDAILEGAGWSSGINAMSQFALDLSDGISFARSFSPEPSGKSWFHIYVVV